MFPLLPPDALSLQSYSVGHLIHQDTKTWNEEFVRFIFEAGTSQQILDTPLFLQVNEDKMVWKPKKNGQYSVRSAYRVCVEEIVVCGCFSFAQKWFLGWNLEFKSST